MIGGEHDVIDTLRRFTQEADANPSMLDGSAPSPEQLAQQQAPQGSGASPQPIDFVGQPGQAPINLASAQPAPQSAMPQPQPEEQSIAAKDYRYQPQTNLSPESAFNAYQQNAANAQSGLNQAANDKKAALAQQSEVKQAQNDIEAAALPDIGKTDEDYYKARLAIDDLHSKFTHDAIAQGQQDVSKLEQLYQKDPHDFWGNSSAVQKIGAVIGMIGAGVSQQNVSEYFQNIVNNSVQESNRKQRVVQQLARLRGQQNDLEQAGYKSDIGAIETRKAAAYKIIGNQIQQRLALTNNPMEQAKLKESLANVDAEAAKHFDDGAQKKVEAGLQAAQLKIAQQRLALEQTELAMKANPEAKDPNEYRALGAFEGRGIQKQVYKEAADKISSSESVVDSIDRARTLLSNPSVQSAYGLRQVNSQILAELRKLQGTGANLSEREVKNIDALTPAWQDVIAGKLGVNDFNKMLTNAQRLVADSALTYTRNVGAPENKLRESSPLYRIRRGEEDEQQAEQTDRAQLGKILGENKSAAARQLKVEAYAKKHPESQLALQILQKMRGSTTGQLTPDEAVARYGP